MSLFTCVKRKWLAWWWMKGRCGMGKVQRLFTECSRCGGFRGMATPVDCARVSDEWICFECCAKIANEAGEAALDLADAAIDELDEAEAADLRAEADYYAGDL